MEKTILYSKHPSLSHFKLSSYESCGHQHCKELIKQINILTVALNQKNIKEGIIKTHKQILKGKQNFLSTKSITARLEKSVQEEIQVIRKNYIRIKKQLIQIENENDQIFEENVQLKKKVEKLQQTLNSKDKIQLSVTKCHDASYLDSKSSFFTGKTNLCQSDIKQRSSDFNYSQSKQFSFKLDGLHSGLRQASTDRSEIYQKYQLLLKEIKQKQTFICSQNKKIILWEESSRRNEEQNCKLKRIIKMRNDIQQPRHSAINQFKNILDQIQV